MILMLTLSFKPLCLRSVISNFSRQVVYRCGLSLYDQEPWLFFDLRDFDCKSGSELYGTCMPNASMVLAY